MTKEQLTELLRKIKEEYMEDSEYTPLTIEQYLLGLAGKVAKYINYWLRFKTYYSDIDEQYNAVYMLRYSYYKEECNVNYSQSEIKDMISHDPELADLRVKKHFIIASMEYLEKCIDNLNKSRYDITNYVEMQKFLAGR